MFSILCIGLFEATAVELELKSSTSSRSYSGSNIKGSRPSVSAGSSIPVPVLEKESLSLTQDSVSVSLKSLILFKLYTLGYRTLISLLISKTNDWVRFFRRSVLKTTNFS